MNDRGRRGAALVLAAALLLAAVRSPAEDRVSGSMQLSYRLSEIRSAGQERIDSMFLRLYKVGLNKDVTPTVTFQGSFDLTELEENEERSTRQVPELRLLVDSDVVDANLGYRLVERGLHGLTTGSDEDRRTTESWNVDLASRGLEDTRARTSYRRDRDYDHLSVRETDTCKDDFYASLDHELLDPLTVGYSLRLRQVEDYADEVTTLTETNEGRMRFRDTYLDGALNTSASYTHTVRETDTQVRGDTYETETSVLAAAGLGDDSEPAAGLPLPALPALIDGDLSTSTGVDIGGAGNTGRVFGLDLDRAGKVDELRLYTTDTAFTPGDYTWALHTSDDGVSWTLVRAAAAFTYDDEKNRFEITAGTSSRWLKIVCTANDATVSPLYVTELEALTLESRGSGSVHKDMAVTKNAQMGLGYRPWDWLALSYDMSQSRRMPEAGAEEDRRDTHSASMRASRAVIEKLTAVGQVQRRLETATGELDRTSNSYLMQLLATPMPTLDSDLSLNRVDSSEGPQLVSRSDTAQLHTGAQLRPGMVLSMEGALSSNRNYTTDVDVAGRSLETSLQMELAKSLKADLSHDMRWTETTLPSATVKGHTSFSKAALYFRPSRDVYLRGSGSVDRDHEAGTQTLRQECRLSWRATRKIQLEAGWATERNEDQKDSANADLTWALSQVFNLRMGYDWMWYRSDVLTEIVQYSVDLTAKF